MKCIILSDIHGNLHALQAVLERIARDVQPDACILLGDLIDYGPHSNEVVELIRQQSWPVLANVRGNHEAAIFSDQRDRFSSDRGRQSSAYTERTLTDESRRYILEEMSEGGQYEFTVAGKRCLAVHGSLADEYWKSIFPDSDLAGYETYDYVFSGHSHQPHCFAHFYRADNPATRNKKKTVFVNPGSVGQPRNLNPRAQFAVWDTESNEILLLSEAYDIAAEQAAFTGQVDDFYKIRLEAGI